MKTIHPTNPVGNLDDTEYQTFLESFQKNLINNVFEPPLFTTDADPEMLWRLYIESYPTKARQHHNCHTCRKFIQTYGGLVTINGDGSHFSPLWRGAAIHARDEGTKAAMLTLDFYAAKRKVTGVFVTDKRELGQSVTGVWRHLSCTLPSSFIYRSVALDCNQRRAEFIENFKNISRCLADYSLEQLATVLKILRSDQLYRAEKVIGPAEWLYSLKQAITSSKQYKHNLIWRAVGNAPNGFCHIRSGVLGTLLDDVALNLPFEDIARRFADKMHPLQYQRPTAPPSEGTIERAEKLVEKMGITRSLERRHAQLADLQMLWQPLASITSPPQSGVFSHLRGSTKPTTEQVAPPAEITWVKFRDTVLPVTNKITILAPARGNYISFVTAADLDAPPILQWDFPEQRNPVSWYMYNGGSTASKFNLQYNQEYELAGITLLPPLWNSERKIEHFGRRAIFIIKGAYDTNSSGLALFPEILKSELHEVRSVIEAHSLSKTLINAGQPHAAGLGFPCPYPIRAHTNLGRVDYIIDRWD